MSLLIQQLESSYVADNDGWAHDPSIDLKHYNVELEPQNVKNVSGLTQKLGNIVALDGNSQLFLALRDMSSDKFINKLNNATNAPDTKVIIYTISSLKFTQILTKF